MKISNQVKENAASACFVIGALAGFSIVSFAVRKAVNAIFE